MRYLLTSIDLHAIQLARMIYLAVTARQDGRIQEAIDVEMKVDQYLQLVGPGLYFPAGGEYTIEDFVAELELGMTFNPDLVLAETLVWIVTLGDKLRSL